MRINVREVYREEFEIFISKYHKFCDALIDLVVDKVPIDELHTYYRRNYPDVMLRLTHTVLSMRGILRNMCSITNISPLKDVIQHYDIRAVGMSMIGDYQCSLDEYLSELRAKYFVEII